ncbi:hypothetical protein ACA910_005578 [Epithemia clementina (nom. ined.)]
MATRLLMCVATGLSFCFCTACASLLGACFGNDKPSTIPPSVTSGRKRSVLLLVLALILSLVFQYAVAPWIVENDFTGYLAENWLDGCEEFANGTELQKSCAGNGGVYRVGAAAVLFFVVAAIAVACKPTFNREVWPAKYVIFFFLCGFSILITNEPLFSDVYLNIARIGGVFFICLQQIIIIDMAYSWNDSWVERSNQADAEEPGTGRRWLAAILASVFAMFALAIGGIIVLFTQFTGCESNDAFIIVTLIMMVLITVTQMCGEEGNLLASSAVSLWAVFLCYTAVSKNPNEECNPQVGEKDNVGIALGLIVTVISMCWTGWSWTAEEKLTSANSLDEPLVGTSSNNASASSSSNNAKGGDSRKVSGVVTGRPTDQKDGRAEQAHGGDPDDDGDDDANSPENTSPRLLSNSWKLNFMLAAITCWMSMALTSWGEIVGDGRAANPSVGRVGMWIVIASQWFVLTLYLWTLLAPRLFPNRDFS